MIYWPKTYLLVFIIIVKAVKTDWSRLYKERKKEKRVTEEEEERKQKDGGKQNPNCCQSLL